MINAGKYNKKIIIFNYFYDKDNEGFKVLKNKEKVLTTYAEVKTTKGYTLIKNGSDFEKAYTNFTIRYPNNIAIDRTMIIEFNNKEYTIEYLNNVNEANIELEIQAKVVEK